MILTIVAVASWCLFAYAVLAAGIVICIRRKRDHSEVIQYLDVEDFE